MNHWKSTLAVIGIGQLISILTSTIVGFSIIFWISNEFKSPTALSLAILAGFLPQFVLGLFTGVYVWGVIRSGFLRVGENEAKSVCL